MHLFRISNDEIKSIRHNVTIPVAPDPRNGSTFELVTDLQLETYSQLREASVLDGVLPTVSLLLTTISVAVLIYYNIRIKSLEIKKIKNAINF